MFGEAKAGEFAEEEEGKGEVGGHLFGMTV